MNRAILTCLPYKLSLTVVFAVAIGMYIYSSACVRDTKLRLSDSVTVVISHYMDKPAGNFTSRAIDIVVAGKRIQRVWCSPMPSNTGVTGCLVALCKGEATRYVAIKDQTAFWIMDLQNPSEVRTSFHEKIPPTIESEFNVTDPGDVIPMPANFSYWIDSLNQKRTLLEK